MRKKYVNHGSLLVGSLNGNSYLHKTKLALAIVTAVFLFSGFIDKPAGKTNHDACECRCPIVGEEDASTPIPGLWLLQIWQL